MKEKHPVRNPDIVMRSEEKEAMLFNPENGNILCINKTGILIWGLCDGKHSGEEIVGKITEKYDVSREEAENDYSEYLSDLGKISFIGFKV
jgi:hypothetical protein